MLYRPLTFLGSLLYLVPRSRVVLSPSSSLLSPQHAAATQPHLHTSLFPRAGINPVGRLPCLSLIHGFSGVYGQSRVIGCNDILANYLVASVVDGLFVYTLSVVQNKAWTVTGV